MATQKKGGYDERIEKLKQQQLQLKEREKILKAKKKVEEREKRTRCMLKIGRVVYSVLGRDYIEGDEERLRTFLKGQDARYSCFTRTMNDYSGGATVKESVPYTTKK